MELRWFVKRDVYKTWDTRWDEWQEHVIEHAPVLQYRCAATFNEWEPIPTVTVTTEKE